MSDHGKPSYNAGMLLMLKYNRIRIDMEELAAELNMARNTIFNLVSAETFPIPTYVDGKRRYADVRDVGEYLDRRRQEAIDAYEAAQKHREWP